MSFAPCPPEALAQESHVNVTCMPLGTYGRESFGYGAMMGRRISSAFSALASWLAKWMGSYWAVVIAALLVVISVAILGGRDTNIAIGIVTLLMVFILQNSQNRDSAAFHVKLDEIITHLEGPRNDVAGIEVKSHEEIEEPQEELSVAEDRAEPSSVQP
jgi:low affinity Fe/Cu permease